jgi:hypothetical protein
MVKVAFELRFFDSDMMNPSMLPLASISILRTSLSKESSDTNDYAVSVFISNLFYAIDTVEKNNEQFGL